MAVYKTTYLNGYDNYWDALNYNPEGTHDTVYAYGGDDIVYGWKGNDNLYGGYGDDTLYGEQGHDYLFGDYGDDYLYGGSGNDVLDGWYGDDVLYGGTGDDTLLGYDGYDILHGNAGDDYLNGEAGFDDLYGGKGVDDLWGGGDGQYDYFYFGWNDSGDVYQGQADTIWDFDSTDQVWLEDDGYGSFGYDFAGYNTSAPGNGEFSIWEKDGDSVVTWNSYDDVGFHDVVVKGDAVLESDVSFYV